VTEPEVIAGPVADSAGVIIYEITLSSGMIVTSPSAFGRPAESQEIPLPPVVTEDGRVLVAPTP
jgi:hypothetical protein